MRKAAATLAFVLLAGSVQAQGNLPPGLTLVSSTREALSQTFVLDTNVSELTEETEAAPSATGPWLVDLDLQAQDPQGIAVGRARSQQASKIQRTELTFDLALAMTTAGNHPQEDAYGSTTFRVQFSTTERMRFTFSAQTAASLGYNRGVVDFYSVLTPTAPIATVSSLGGFTPASSGAAEGWLQPGDYVLYANCESLAGGSGAGPADSQSASATGGLRLFHECDYDLDGDVDLLDRQLFLAEWATGLGSTDFDGDGDSDQADAVRFIILWRYALRP